MSRYGSSSYSGESEGNVWTLIVGILAILSIFGMIIFLMWYVPRMKPAIVYGVAFDVSKSMSEQEKRLATEAMRLIIDEIDARERRVKIYRYAEIIREVSDSIVYDSKDLESIFEKMILKYIGNWGTHQSLPLKQFVELAEKTKDEGKPIVLCLFTDGEDHSPQETYKVAEQLARMENVKCVIVGPLKEQYRLQIQKSLQPLKDAGKLRLFGEFDAGEVVDAIRNSLNN